MYDLSSHIILVIDDEDDNLLVLESTLSLLHGATVRVAKDAEEALEILKEFHPTTIVTDLSMPKMDGFELLKVLRQRTDTNTLPIIAVTAHAMSGDRERVLAAGFDGYISKPFEVVTVGDQIGSLLEAHRAQQPVTPADAQQTVTPIEAHQAQAVSPIEAQQPITPIDTQQAVTPVEVRETQPVTPVDTHRAQQVVVCVESNIITPSTLRTEVGGMEQSPG